MLNRLLKCRFTHKVLFLLFLLLVAAAAFLYYEKIKEESRLAPTVAQDVHTKPPTKHISKLITVVIRQFEEHENDMADTVQSVLSLFPNVDLVVVSNGIPYPPFEFSVSNTTLRNVKVVDIDYSLLKSPNDTDPMVYIKTKYVLFLPDSVRLSSRNVIQKMIVAIAYRRDSLVVVPFASAMYLSCQKVDWNTKEWTLKYDHVMKGVFCDAVTGKHAILVESDVLRMLPHPFELPFPESLYLQTATRKYKVYPLLDYSFADGRALFRSQITRQQHNKLEHMRRATFYKKVSIKKVTRGNGHVEWYGCSRNTERCFPAVVKTPSYLLSGLWTPPCCLMHLRKTALHVFRILQDAKVRCWLEGQALVGALRRMDVLLWADHVDIGIYEADIAKVESLKLAFNRGVIKDSEGYQWEKATQGDFYRVLYSKRNRISVNILPFGAKNGTMVVNGWFIEHQRAFPESFVRPLSTVDFAGVQVPCPNNAKRFIDFKFGNGSLERQTYPNSVIPYP